MIELTNPKWVDRPKSNLVNWLLKNSNAERKELAMLLGITGAAFDNKMSRNSFSVEDILLIADVCGCIKERSFGS